MVILVRAALPSKYKRQAGVPCSIRTARTAYSTSGGSETVQCNALPGDMAEDMVVDLKKLRKVNILVKICTCHEIHLRPGNNTWDSQ